MMDTLTFSGFMQRLKEACSPASANRQQAANPDAAGPSQQATAADHSSSTGDDVLLLCLEAIQNVAQLLQGSVQLKSYGDVRQACLEGFAELAGCAKAVKGKKGAAKAAGGQQAGCCMST